MYPPSQRDHRRLRSGTKSHILDIRQGRIQNFKLGGTLRFWHPLRRASALGEGGGLDVALGLGGAKSHSFASPLSYAGYSTDGIWVLPADPG